MIRFGLAAAALIAMTGLAGCGSVPLPQHQASVEAIQSLRGGGTWRR